MTKTICPKCNKKRDEELFLVYHKTAGFPDTVKNCRICRNEKNRLLYSENKDILKMQNIKSRKKNINKYRKTTNIRNKKYTDDLTDGYVTQLLIKYTELKIDDIKLFPELIEAKRLLIQINREIKNQTT